MLCYKQAKMRRQPSRSRWDQLRLIIYKPLWCYIS